VQSRRDQVFYFPVERTCKESKMLSIVSYEQPTHELLIALNQSHNDDVNSIRAHHPALKKAQFLFLGYPFKSLKHNDRVAANDLVTAH
jgi:hypothetical protein